MKNRFQMNIQAATVVLSITLLSSVAVLGQPPQAPSPGFPDQSQQQQPVTLLSPQQLDNLVAPVALYPDPLLGQVLAASTYPLEMVEAQQWRQQNGGLQGTALIEAAKQFNWDPSVQALVAFPDTLSLLANGVQWTTSLGNAFLAQQEDVMAAVQRMRARAQRNGRLVSNAQEVVNTTYQGGDPTIEIQPADPQVMYVPVYQPEYVWGPPAWGVYPSLWYPSGFGLGWGWGSGIYIGSYFPGWGGWGGWGWGCGWHGSGLFVNTGFFHDYGFRGGYGYRGGFAGGGRYGWEHDPIHRMGVAYPNRVVAGHYNSGGFNSGRYTGGGRFNGNASGGQQSYRGGNMPSQRGAGSAAPRYQAPGAGGYRSGPSYSRPAAPRGQPNYSGSAAPHYQAPGVSGFRSGSSYSTPAAPRGQPNYPAGAAAPGYQAPGAGGYRSGPSYSTPAAPRGQPNYSGSAAPHYQAPGVSGYRSGPYYSTPSAPRSQPNYPAGAAAARYQPSGAGGYRSSGPSYSMPAPSRGAGGGGQSRSGGQGFTPPTPSQARNAQAPRFSGGGGYSSGGGGQHSGGSQRHR